MPDITMCKDENCNKKEKCHRFTAIPWNFGQSYFMNSPRKKDGCVYFYPNDIYKKLENGSKERKKD